jgi:tight adherence protein B
VIGLFVLILGNLALDLVSYGPAGPQPAVTDLATGSGGTAQAAATGPALTTALHGLAGRLPVPVTVVATVPVELSGRGADLAISVAAGGTTRIATATVTFAVDPKAAATVPGVRLRLRSPIILAVGLGCIGLGVTVAGFVGMYLVLGRSGFRRRLRQLERFGSKAAAEVPQPEQEGSVVVRTALALSERAVQRQGRTAIEVALDRAGIALRPAEWMLVRAAVAAAGAVLLALMLPCSSGSVGGVSS